MNEFNPYDVPANKIFSTNPLSPESIRKPRKPKAEQNTYDVLVGNIGFVRSGISRAEALKVFDEYVAQSKSIGRASGEDVTIFNGDEIFKEYLGSNGQMLDAAKLTHILKNLIVEAKNEHHGFDHFSSITESVTNNAAGMIITLKNGSKFHINVIAQEFSRKS